MTDVVWSIIILLSIGLVGVAWVIYKVLIWDNEETDSTNNHSNENIDS